MKIVDMASHAPHGLASLPRIELNAVNERRLETAKASAGGPPPWRRRKEVEARQLLALSQIAPRLRVLEIDMEGALRAAVSLFGPVPCMPTPSGSLAIERQALLGIVFRQECLTTPLPGYAFVQVLHPRHVWHPNVAPDRGQPICLGVSLPVGIPVTELVLLSYGALTLQSVMLDEKDAAGVLNAAAGRWWQKNRNRIPLSREPFLSTANSLERGSR